MKSYPVIIERCPETELYVGHIPGLPGGHAQGMTLEELQENLEEAIRRVLERRAISD